jgi:glycosyltransferase involved in cell wall biosynthesis
MNLLSLIMIVRNEAAQLPDFLRHHSDLFDEMIIVDTGSEDESPQLIESSGALLIRHSWENDFSEARNRGLSRATGKWLMILDADERISSRDFSLLRKFLAKAPSAVYLQKTINYFLGNRHLEWQPVSGVYPHEEMGQTGFFAAHRAGLFPNGQDLEFSGRVHESILPSAAKADLDIFRLEIPVHHYGYVLSPEINRERREHYRQLVKLKLADEAGDWSALLEMASIDLEDARPTEASLHLERLVSGPDDHPSVNRGRFLLGRLKREEGQIDSARQLLLKAREADPTFLFAWLEGVRLEADLGSWSAVSDLLSLAKGHFPASEPLLMRENLMMLVKTGQLVEAASVAAQLAEICPQWQEIQTLAGKLAQVKNFGKPR